MGEGSDLGQTVRAQRGKQHQAGARNNLSVTRGCAGVSWAPGHRQDMAPGSWHPLASLCL